jgi:outer membrane lipoprotein SlyB
LELKTMKALKVIAVATALVIATASLTGCATPVGGRDYYADQTRMTGTIQEGTVLQVRRVEIHNRNNGYSQYGGGAIGAAVGGLVGSRVGNGNGSYLAAALGGLIGGAAGTMAQNSLGSQTGIEVDLRLDNGQRIFVTQGADSSFAPGQRVRVMASGGVYRIAH